MRLTTTVAVLLALSGCGGGPVSNTTTVSTSLATTTGPSPTSTGWTPLANTTSTIGMVLVPNVVGKNLATARAIFAAAGFNRLTANDGTQKKWVPADDWIVFRQSPPAGQRAPTTVYMYLELLRQGERYTNPGTTPCPPFVRC